MMNIFISYNRQSESIAKSLVDDLETLGHTVWYDQELSGGQIWWDQILATIRDCDVFILVLTPESLNSTACKREYSYAVDLGKSLLPVLVAEGVSKNLLPPALSLIQFVDYRKQNRNAAFRLARALTTVPPPVQLPKPLPSPPEVPISFLTSLTEKIETTSILSYEKQSALLVDLKRSLHEPETADDAYVLFERLRKRHDLLASIAEEIDELLSSTNEASMLSDHSRKPKLPPKSSVNYSTEKRESITKPSNTDNLSHPLKLKFVMPAFSLLSRFGSLSTVYLISIILGVICGFALIAWQQDWNLWLGLLIPLITWGVSGLLFARHSQLLAIVLACVCFVMGLIIFGFAPG